MKPATAIAVLPFVNMSSNEENEYFCDGITEEIITALSRIQNLKVTSRTSSFYFKNKSLPLLDVAQQLNVAVILEGSIRVAGNMIRITAQLIQAEDDFHFWSETWDRKLENIFEIQDEISLEIADKLREQFGHLEVGEHLVKKQTSNLDAYQYSLKARFHFNKWNPEAVKIAIDLWEKALALDPAHSESYVGLADAYGFLATTGFMPYVEAWQKATELTNKALELDPQNPGAHYQLANIAFFTRADFQEAFSHALKAVELQPSYPEAQQFMSFLYILADKPELSWKHLKQALDTDPLNQETLFYKAYYHYRTGDPAQTLEILNQALIQNEKNLPAIVTKCYCLLVMKQPDQALAFLNAQPEEIIVPGDRVGINCLAEIISSDGKPGSTLKQLEEEAEDPMAFQQHSYLFQAYAHLGENDKAFAVLDRALAIKSSILLLGFSDPLAQKLKNDSRFLEYQQRLYGSPTEPGASNKKASLLDEATAAEFSLRLETYMNEEEPYLDPKISLRGLANRVEIHPNQLSWLLNEKFGRNFNDFINHYRIEVFKSLALDPGNSHISLIGLAYESGFNSKTVFNTYFKKEMNMTPKEFLKSSQESR